MVSAIWRFNIEAGGEVQVLYLGVAFTRDGSRDEELNVRSGKANAVMRALYHSVVLERDLSRKAKLLVFKSIFVPILIYGNESWVMTDRVRS